MLHANEKRGAKWIEVAYRRQCAYSCRALEEIAKHFPGADVRLFAVEADNPTAFIAFQNRMNAVLKTSGKRYTFPQIFIDGEYIGGCNELVSKLC